MAIGLAFFMNLRADTPTPVLWTWMLVAGLGVGPTMAIFTLIVQNDVSFEMLGTATSDLTLFRQIGTSVGLTMAFTLFRNNLTWGLIHDSVVGAGAPAAAVPVAAPPTFDIGRLVSVGVSPTDAFAGLPKELIGFFTIGFHQAFSIAIANCVWLGVIAAVLGADCRGRAGLPDHAGSQGEAPSGALPCRAGGSGRGADDARRTGGRGRRIAGRPLWIAR